MRSVLKIPTKTEHEEICRGEIKALNAVVGTYYQNHGKHALMVLDSLADLAATILRADDCEVSVEEFAERIGGLCGNGDKTSPLASYHFSRGLAK